jgi:signal transduction histidine kinase
MAETLEKQDRLRKQLTADVAHELRTPLTALGMYLENMIEGVWKPTPERMQNCYGEIARLSHLVADLEKLEQAEYGNLNLNKEEVDLTRLVRMAIGNFEGVITAKALNVMIESASEANPSEAEHTEGKPPCPVLAYVDGERISGVVTNLLSNAIKYTPEGGEIRLSVLETEETAILVVEDNGPGISEDEIPYIFERFYRADKSRNRSTGGAGIGLAIVQSVVLAHGGSVKAENRKEGGSRFTVALPRY